MVNKAGSILGLLVFTFNGISSTFSLWSCCKEGRVSCSVMSDSMRPMDYSLPGSSVHGILQARILEWVAIPFSRGSVRDIR